MKPKESKKHRKKHSSKRKKNASQNSSESSSDSLGSDKEEEWVEKSVPDVSSVNKDTERESWMEITTSSTFFKEKTTSSKSRLKREEDTIKRLGLDKPGQHAKELNPYWKDGGCGLPTTSKASCSTAPAVGDSGLKWLQKAYQRSVEQAREEQRPLEDVVAERWGSLENLERLIEEASNKLPNRSSSSTSKDDSRYREHRRRRDSGSPKRHRHPREERSGEKSDYYHTKTERRTFLAPKDDTSEDPAYPNKIHATTSRHAVPKWKKKVVVAEEPQPSTGTRNERELNLLTPVKTIEKDVSHKSNRQTSDHSDDEEQMILTDKEMNELGAKIVKAEILGNMELANQLKAKLEAAQKHQTGNAMSYHMSQSERPKEVVLMLTDSKGMTRPLQRSEGVSSESSTRRSKKQKVVTHSKEGHRERYFADDDKYSLKQMFQREKLSTAEDQDAMFARLAGRGIDKTNEDYDIDDVFTTRANRAVNEAKIEEGERLRAITEFKKSSAAIDRCKFCFEGAENPKHLIVAAGMKVYLRVPETDSLTEGQCLITPMQHVLGATYLDEDVWAEIKIFRKGLTAMFKDRDLDVVYFETCMYLKKYPHMVIQCVPLPKDVGSLAPMYFKKAILESETEWAHNKKLVELKDKDIQKSVPKGLPYFCVEFGLDGGFAHVIEDEQLFPQNFAQEIIGGMLDLDPNAWRRPHRQQFEEQRKKVLQLIEWWRPYDWTKRLRDSD